MTHTFQLVGLLTSEPTLLNGTTSSSLDVGFDRTYPMSVSGSVTVNATSGSPLTLSLEGISNLNLLAIKVLDGASIAVKVTSPADGNATVQVSSLWIWHSPLSSDVLTAVQVWGTGEIEYLLAGT